MDRDRDRRPSDRYPRESYRPGRSPPRDNYRSTRSPPRRGPAPIVDTYIPSSNRPSRPRSRSPPPSYRRRTRSPPRGEYRGRDSESWRGRPRSPPRRGYSPHRDDYRRDNRPRSPPRDGYYDPRYAPRSPPTRDRSPVSLKRSREVSPVRSRGVRSPPPSKRERLVSPTRAGRYEEPRPRVERRYSPRDSRSFRPRSRSPRREDRVDPYAIESWRRRSPSPVRGQVPSVANSGRESLATSRRSSPPAHGNRPAQLPEERELPASLRPQLNRVSPKQTSPNSGRSLECEPQREREREYLRSPQRRRESPPREHEHINGAPPPSGPAPYRNGDMAFTRVPPTGPSGSRNFSSSMMSPPVGPSSSQVPMSAHSRAGNPILSAPSRPRGRGGHYPGEPREYPPRDYSAAPPRRGSYGGRGGYYGPPPGPRGGPVPYNPPPFRGSSNNTSTTYPRTQRFRDHLADLPSAIPGGQTAAEVVDTAKIKKLEEEAKKLRDMIAEKETKLRQGMREWDNLERESNTASLKADLADEHLRRLNGEDTSTAAF